MTKFATGLFFRAKRQLNALGSGQIGGNDAECEMDLAASESTVDVEDENKVSDVSDYNITQSTHQNSELMNNQEAATEDVEINIHYPLVQPASIGSDIDSRTSYDLDDPYNFKHFDVAENPSDHHYFGDAEMVIDFISCMLILRQFKYISLLYFVCICCTINLMLSNSSFFYLDTRLV